MAHSLSAQKRIRQNAKRRAQNRRRKDTVRTAIKELRDLIARGTAAECESKLKEVIQILDKAGTTSAYHKNTTSRYKSRLTLAVNKKKAAKAA